VSARHVRLASFLAVAAFVALGAACSGDDSDDDTTPSADEVPEVADAPATTPDGDDTDDDTGGAPTTEGLTDYLDTNYPDDGFATEVSLLSTGPGLVLVGTQTSFFEPDEAVAFCEAVSQYVYDTTAQDPLTTIELESTGGTLVAERASADDDCVAG
jgi:hypothetical protein